MKRRTKWLGSYLLAASLLQICIYLAWSLSPENLSSIFYFDPRIGLYFIESSIRGGELKIPGVLQWASAIWLLLISVLLLSGRRILKTYLISEMIASIPNLLFFGLVLLASVGPAHGFSIGELFFPILVLLLFTIVPVVLAFRSRKVTGGSGTSQEAKVTV